MKAELTLVNKVDRNRQSLFVYNLKITGADPDQKYSLVDWPVADVKPSIKMDGLRVDDDGAVYCPANSSDTCTKYYAGSVVQLAFLPSKGEIFRSAVISVETKTGVFFSVVPDPVTATDKTCNIEVVRLDPNFALAVVRGKGFAPAEPLVLHTESSKEVHDNETNADSNGAIYAELMPSIKGKKSGKTELTLRGKSCAPKLSFNWGL